MKFSGEIRRRSVEKIYIFYAGIKKEDELCRTGNISTIISILCTGYFP